MKTITFNQLKRLVKESYSEIKDIQRRGLYYAVGYYGYSNEDYDIVAKSKDKNSVIKNAKEEYAEGIFDCINVCNPDGTVITSFGNTSGAGYDGGYEDGGYEDNYW